MSYVFRLILSNGLAFVCFLLVIFSNIHIKTALVFYSRIILFAFPSYVVFSFSVVFSIDPYM